MTTIMSPSLKNIPHILITALLALACALPAHAKLKVTGSGDTLGIDTSGFPPEMTAAYKIMEVKCTKCHTLERSVIAIQTGIGPISGDIFDQNSTKAYGIKMLRKPDSDMTKDDVKTVVGLLNYLLDVAAK